MLIAQITDCHIVEPGGVMADRVDPSVGLARAVEFLNGLADDLDLVVATGDLVNDGTPAQYDRLQAMLADLRATVLVVPGNHDDRSELRARFPGLPPGGPDDPIDHVVTVGHGDGVLRLALLDTTIPGRHDGCLTDAQVAWLDGVLSEAPTRPTLVVQHHPPFRSGIASMDRYGLANRDGEVAVLNRHPQVIGLIAGHFHRPIHHRAGTLSAFACPSTAAQLAPRLGGGPTRYSTDAPALALHVGSDRGSTASLSTHVVQLADAEEWVPAWALDEHVDDV